MWPLRSRRKSAQRTNTLFFHVAAVAERHQQVFDRLMERIVGSPLVDCLDAAHVNIVGTGSLDVTAVEPQLNIVVHRNGEPDDFEFGTLELVHDFTRQRRGENVLYIHSKGVSKSDPTDFEAGVRWADLMATRLVGRFQECLDFLQCGYDTVGMDWANSYEGRPVPLHYSGNFWWASTDYLRQLPAISQIRTKPIAFKSLRHNAEFWIGIGKPRAASLCHFEGTAFCSDR